VSQKAAQTERPVPRRLPPYAAASNQRHRDSGCRNVKRASANRHARIPPSELIPCSSSNELGSSRMEYVRWLARSPIGGKKENDGHARSFSERKSLRAGSRRSTEPTTEPRSKQDSVGIQSELTYPQSWLGPTGLSTVFPRSRIFSLCAMRKVWRSGPI